jgi:hypothetical protein
VLLVSARISVCLFSTGEKRLALLAADAEFAEAADKEERRKIAENSALSYTGVPDASTILTPPPATPTPQQPEGASTTTTPPAATTPPA